MLTRDTLAAGWPEPVEVRETHVSLVLLTRDRAYKFKKAVRLPFLDLTDPARRAELCAEEVRLNRDLCPDVYLGVVRLTREADGRLAVNGAGALVEPGVEMVRLPEDRMVDALLRAGDTDAVAEALPAIVEQLAAFHARAARADEEGQPDAIARRMRPVLDLARGHLPEAFHRRLTAYVESNLATKRGQFERRAARGFVREGHGDLHAANICLTHKGPRIYDRLEFSRSMRCGDVAFDLAFLNMSLDAAGASDLGATLSRLYSQRTDDPEFGPLCSFYRVQRALVRANVATMRGGEPERVRAYDRLALGYAVAPAAVLLCGLPATGKSTRARELATPLLARIVSSDVVRKRLCGRAPDERWEGGYDEGPYRPEVTDRVYELLARDVARTLDNGRSVIVDATLARRAHRELLVEAIGGRPYVLVHLVRSDAELQRNLAARAARPDVSDADRAVVAEARGRFEPPDEIRARRKVEDAGDEGVLDRILARLA